MERIIRALLAITESGRLGFEFGNAWIKTGRQSCAKADKTGRIKSSFKAIGENGIKFHGLDQFRYSKIPGSGAPLQGSDDENRKSPMKSKA